MPGGINNHRLQLMIVAVVHTFTIRSQSHRRFGQKARTQLRLMPMMLAILGCQVRPIPGSIKFGMQGHMRLRGGFNGKGNSR